MANFPPKALQRLRSRAPWEPACRLSATPLAQRASRSCAREGFACSAQMDRKSRADETGVNLPTRQGGATEDHPSTRLPGPATDSGSSVAAAEFRQLWRRGAKKIEAGNAEAEGLATSGKGKSRGRMTQDEKVEKHRMIVRRSYYQKKELKNQLKTEIASLEALYQQLVGDAAQLQIFHGTRHHGLSPSSESDSDTASTSSITGDTLHCSTCTQIQSLRQRYKEISITKESLLRQREALEEQLHEHINFQDKVDQLLARDLQVDSDLHGRDTATTRVVTTTPPINSASDPAMVVQTDEFLVSFKPLVEEECLNLIRAAFVELRSQTTCGDFHDVDAHPIMGWTRKRTYGERANFSLLKRFPDQSARVLWDQTWRLYAETRLFEQLYSGTVNMKFSILQRINDSNLLFCRTLKTEKLRIRNVTFFLFSRFQVDGKYFILFRSIDKNRVMANHPAEAVLGMFSWLSFWDEEARPSEDANIASSATYLEFGGAVPSNEVADTEFWMMEFLSYLLRLENRAIGPIFQVLQ